MRISTFFLLAVGMTTLAMTHVVSGAADTVAEDMATHQPARAVPPATAMAPLIRGAYFDTAIRPEYFGSNHLPARTNAPVIIPALRIMLAGTPPIRIPATRFEVSKVDAKLWEKGMTIWAEIDIEKGTGTIALDALDSPRFERNNNILVAVYKPATGLASVIPVAESAEEQAQFIRQMRNHQIRHAGITALMADKLLALTKEPASVIEWKRGKDYLDKHPPRKADKLFRILLLGDSLVTALDGIIKTPDGKNGMVNTNALSKLGVDVAPPFMEYRNVPSVFYELLIQQRSYGQPWQGDIEFRRFSHKDFKYAGKWESNQLIESRYPEWEKLGLPRFFDYRSPAAVGDSMEIKVKGRRYVNIIYAKRFESGKFRIEVDGVKVRDVNCAEGLKYDNKFSNSKIYSVNDVVDCREPLDLGNDKEHTIRIVAADVSKPVRIWGVEMWNTPSFIVMNGGKSGLCVNHFAGVIDQTGKYLQPDIIVLEVSANDQPYQFRENLTAYRAIINRCQHSGVPIVFAIPPLAFYSPWWKDTMNNVRTLLDSLHIPYIDMQKQLILEAENSGLPLEYYQKEDGHPNIPGIEAFARELLLPFLNDGILQTDMFKGDSGWNN
ncbi:MAG: hypothetical protein PHW60_05325 [Kiritimatiellae bacterium]|nr:hypothetical protein [Kiritimatiellia bacterium]